MSIKDHARNALCLIEICPANTSGVVFRLADWMNLACTQGFTPTERNAHVITRAYIHALSDMQNRPCFSVDEIEFIRAELLSIINSKEIAGL